ncbi:hypothetical protein ILYODFUR_004114 [Ilyodon furcidens]|uniref:Uncharacterized protein n=1 Tax=Ilyodon furcidens TaxID=33524 RepID=A0ABV0VAY1_9TELE
MGLLLFCPNLTSDHAEEKLSRAAKFEETSTVFKQLATANLLSCGEWRPFCRPAKTARYRNHGDTAPVVLLLDRENRSARLRRDRVSVRNFSGTVCFCRLQRES